MTSKINFNDGFGTFSIGEISGWYLILNFLKGENKILNISRSSSGAKGRDKLCRNKYSIYHLFRLSIFVIIMLNVLGVKCTMALSIFSKVISTIIGLFVSQGSSSGSSSYGICW